MIRFDEGLRLETSAFQIFHGSNIRPLSTRLIKPYSQGLMIWRFWQNFRMLLKSFKSCGIARVLKLIEILVLFRLNSFLYRCIRHKRRRVFLPKRGCSAQQYCFTIKSILFACRGRRLFVFPQTLFLLFVTAFVTWVRKQPINFVS